MVAAIRPHPGSAPLVRSQRPVRLAAAAVALAASTAQLVDFGVYDQRLRAWDMMTHNSVFGVVSLAALGVAVLAALATAIQDDERRVQFACLSGLLGLLLALRIAQPPHVLLLALPVSVAALGLLWTAAPAGTARRVMRDGCIVLALAFLVHGVGAAIVLLARARPRDVGLPAEGARQAQRRARRLAARRGGADTARARAAAQAEGRSGMSAQPQADMLASLSPRETTVLEMTSQGLKNGEIAERLDLSVHAVKFHLASIYRKLGVGNRTEAAVAYLRAGR